MSLSSITGNQGTNWFSNPGSNAIASAGDATSSLQSLMPSSSSGTASQTGGTQASGSGDLFGDLSAAIQAMLVQLQGGQASTAGSTGASTASAATTATPSTGGTLASTDSESGTASATGGHGHHHHYMFDLPGHPDANGNDPDASAGSLTASGSQSLTGTGQQALAAYAQQVSNMPTSMISV